MIQKEELIKAYKDGGCDIENIDYFYTDNLDCDTIREKIGSPKLLPALTNDAFYNNVTNTMLIETDQMNVIFDMEPENMKYLDQYTTHKGLYRAGLTKALPDYVPIYSDYSHNFDFDYETIREQDKDNYIKLVAKVIDKKVLNKDFIRNNRLGFTIAEDLQEGNADYYIELLNNSSDENKDSLIKILNDFKNFSSKSIEIKKNNEDKGPLSASKKRYSVKPYSNLNEGEESLSKLSTEELANRIMSQIETIDFEDKKQRQDFIQYLGVSILRKYSYRNSMLLNYQAQRRKLLPYFATFNEWKEKTGCSVKKKEEGLWVLHPKHIYTYYKKGGIDDSGNIIWEALPHNKDFRTVKEYDEQVKKGELIRKDYLSFILLKTAFSISQTTMKEEDRPEYIKRFNTHKGNEDNKTIYDKLIQICSDLGLSFAEKIFDNECLGYILNDKDIFISKEMPINAKINTLAHELGHYLLHREELSIPGYRLDTLNEEVQAQLFSQLFCESVGIDSEDNYSLNYVSSYLDQAAKNYNSLKSESLYNNISIVYPIAAKLTNAITDTESYKKSIDTLKTSKPDVLSYNKDEKKSIVLKRETINDSKKIKKGGLFR